MTFYYFFSSSVKEPQRQEVGYKLVGKFSKYRKCSVIHEVNTKFLCLSVSHHRCYI